MINFKIFMVFLISIVFSATLVAAIDCGISTPDIPHEFQGYAKYSGSVLASKTVTATLDGNAFSVTTDSSGYYKLLQVEKCSDSAVTAITFTVCTRAAETASFSSGAFNTSANLTISSACPTGAVTPPSGGGGGGGGGGGAAVAVSATSQTINTGAVAAGGTASAEFTAEDLGVTDIKITVKQAVTASSVTVVNQGSSRGIATNAITAAEAAGNMAVYSYLKITVGKISNTNIEKATVKFKVPKTAGYDPSTVELRRYDSSKKVWSSLPTKFTSEVGGYYYFEAETTSFSIFAVVGKLSVTMMELLDMVREFYAGTSPYTMMELLDSIRAFYGG